MVQVLLYHAWTVGSPIGVDAFIMISAYLMTGSFIRRAEMGRTPKLFDRWGTTFKRLLPPLAVVVLITLLASIAILPQNRWPTMVDQSYASLTYWQNWLLEWMSVDYFALDHAASSPLQHLWSMAMQGQVFVLWPALMIALVWFAREFYLSIRKTIFVGFSLITAASLMWLMTTTLPAEAVYFDTRARIWEFALGSEIAAIAPRLKLWRPAERMLAALALVVLVVYSLVLIGTYPGPMAAVPLLATSALLLFSKDDPVGPAKILGWRPLVELGNISYAVYLVHWPLFVLYLVATGQERLGVTNGLVLIGISVVLAWLLTKYVDTPARTMVWASTPRRKAFVVGFTLWVALTVVMTVQSGITQTAHAQTLEAERIAAESARAASAKNARPYSSNLMGPGTKEPADTQSDLDGDEGADSADLPVMQGHPGAPAMLYGGQFNFESAPIPSPLQLDSQWITYSGECSELARSWAYRVPKTGCHAHGDPASPVRVLVGGGSHAEQILMPAAQLLADREGYYVEAVLKTACQWMLPDPNAPSECGQQGANLLEYAKQEPFDYVFLIVTNSQLRGPNETLIYGIETLIKELTATGAEVFGIRDNMRPGQNLFECASSQDPHAAFGGCVVDRDEHFGPDSVIDPLLDIPGFHYLETMDLYCDGAQCPSIAGNVQIYLDGSHITGSYGETMAPILLERMSQSLSASDPGSYSYTGRGKETP